MAGAPAGNTNAAKGKRVRDSILRALGRAGSIDAGLDLACNRLVRMIEEGSTADDFKWAFEQIANRLDGKPAQQVILNGDEEGGAVKIHSIEVKAVDP